MWNWRLVGAFSIAKMPVAGGLHGSAPVMIMMILPVSVTADFFMVSAVKMIHGRG